MKTKRLWMTVLATLFLAAFIGGCMKDDFVEVTGLCPLVVSTDPVSAATGVPLDKIVTATFNKNMNPVTITQSSFTVSQGSTLLTGTVTYSGMTASFDPASPLTVNTTYTGTVKNSVKDLTGNALETDYVWNFSTGAILAPTVILTDPLNTATGVALNKTVTANFSETMNGATLTATTFTLNDGVNPDIAGVVSYAGVTASLNPTADLLAGTLYTATITTGAMNPGGTPLAADYVWTFTTVAAGAPTVILTDPVDLASGVALNKVITADFSEAMNGTTITDLTFTLMLGATPVTGTVSYLGVRATFIPDVNLLSGSTYTAKITTGAQNPGGIGLASDYSWTFSTVAPLGPIAPDLLTVARFGIIAGVGVTNAAGASEIHDLDVGIYPGARSSITGFFDVDGGPGLIFNGAFYASDDIAPPGVNAMLNQAKLDLVAAYLFAEGATSPAPAIIAGDQGGTTLYPGIYKSTSTLLIQSGDLTLDAQGDANAVWIFQIASDFTTVGGSPYPSPAGGNVILAGNAQAKNIYWQVGTSAIIGDYTSFKGNVLALTSITMNAYSRGRRQNAYPKCSCYIDQYKHYQ